MWEILTSDLFDEWFSQLDDTDRESVLASLILLREKGPQLARPYADTLQDSGISNLKELRIQSRGKPIRAFFAFDPARDAIMLCAGDKSGDKRFYKKMIPIAEAEYEKHLLNMEKGNG